MQRRAPATPPGLLFPSVLIWMPVCATNKQTAIIDAARISMEPHPLTPALSQRERVRNGHDEIETSSCRINNETAVRKAPYPCRFLRIIGQDGYSYRPCCPARLRPSSLSAQGRTIENPTLCPLHEPDSSSPLFDIVYKLIFKVA